MKFGKLPNTDGIDFVLPEDHIKNKSLLEKLPRSAPSSYSGGTMWGVKSWKGSYYPEKTPQKDFISAYCQQFGTIELNATHYKIHPPETIIKWSNQAPDGFKFCPKFPQLISHYRRFNNCEGLTDEFLEAISAFDEKLGPSFIQLPPHYAPKHSEALKTYLKKLPSDIPISIEFRHPEWFMDSKDSNYMWDLIYDLQIGGVISATAGRRDAIHMRLSSDHLIVRYGGYSLEESDHLRLKQWTEKLGEWHSAGLKDSYFLIHQPDSVLTPETAELYGELIQKNAGLETKSPKKISPATLF